MRVDFTSITSWPDRPDELHGLTEQEALIIHEARVSNPENQMNFETGVRLMKYLIRSKHWSPFDLVDMTVKIETTRAVAQQILRHRSFCFQEFSQRYSNVEKQEGLPYEIPVLRLKAEKNRQSSEHPIALPSWQQEVLDEALINDFEIYNHLI